MTPNDETAENLIVKKLDIQNRMDMETDPERQKRYKVELGHVEAQLNKLRQK